MPPVTTRLRSERGFTIVETLVAAFVLAIAVASTVALVRTANAATSTSRAREAATNLVRELVEAARGMSYGSITDPGLDARLQAMPGLADSAAGGAYTIVRRGVTYTVSTRVCVMDDAKDGGGTRPAGLTFCSDSTAPGTTDKNPEDYKRVTMTAQWTRDGQTRAVTQTGLINNPGSASGPAVRSLALLPPNDATPYQITSPSVATVRAQFTTSSKPYTTSWSIDGTVQPTPPYAADGSGVVWNFDWPIKTGTVTLDDGPYLLSAKAFNQYGVSGPSRSATVVLNRYPPRAPIQVTGGRTRWGTVEIEWTANTERDIVGYEVVRDGTVVCPLATQKLNTFCTDSSPPAASPVTYNVRAYDSDPVTGNPRFDPAVSVSDPLVVGDGDQPPAAPGIVDYSYASGVATIKWTKPSDPDAGDSIAFYRVYRDGKALANRYDRWFDSSGTVTYTDTDTGGTSHTYWITAVDDHYMESSFAGPVGP